jgi:hypothetical protein
MLEEYLERSRVHPERDFPSDILLFPSLFSQLLNA